MGVKTYSHHCICNKDTVGLNDKDFFYCPVGPVVKVFSFSAKIFTGPNTKNEKINEIFIIIKK